MSAGLARLASRNSETQKGDPGFRWTGKTQIELENQELRRPELESHNPDKRVHDVGIYLRATAGCGMVPAAPPLRRFADRAYAPRLMDSPSAQGSLQQEPALSQFQAHLVGHLLRVEFHQKSVRAGGKFGGHRGGAADRSAVDPRFGIGDA